MAELTRADARSLPPEAVVAAGLLAGMGLRDPNVTSMSVDDMVDALWAIMHPNALWQPASVGPEIAEQLRHDPFLAPATWRRPDRIDSATVAILVEAWNRALPEPRVQDPPGYAMERSLRLRVDEPTDARLMRDIGVVGDVMLAPNLASSDVREIGSRSGSMLRWRWPMSIAVVDGPRAQRWLADIRNSVHYGVIYTAEIIPDPLAGDDVDPATPDRDDPDRFFEMAIADASDWTGKWVQDRVDRAHQFGAYPASCVIAVADRSPAETLISLLAMQDPAVAVAFPAEPDQWWYTLFHELSHDNPIDVAVAKADPAALVATPESGAELTAAARWFLAAAETEPFLARQADQIQHWDFTYEREGASNISRLGQAVEDQTGSRPMVVAARPLPEMMGPPPDAATRPAPRPAAKKVAKRPAKKSAEPRRTRSASKAAGRPAKKLATKTASGGGGRGGGRKRSSSTPSRPTRQQGSQQGRRLISEFWPAAAIDGENPEPLRKVLPPAADVLLEVKIAVPKAGQIAADEDFPVVPTDRPTETLEVVATSDELWDTPRRQEISLPTAPDQLDQPSTSAVFEFTAPGSGRVVEVDIVVYFRNRPLQAATLSAAVRSRSLPTDKPALRTYTITGPSEPTADASPVDASLDARGAELRDRSGNRLAVANIQDVLDEFEGLLSRRLGVVDAPTRLDDDRARQVLIELARRGSQLHTQLGVFGLDRKHTIDLLVNDVSTVFPIELVYDGAAPNRSAKPCGHVTDPANHTKPKRCRRNASRVCPYGFWGMTRVISRSVMAPLVGDRLPVTVPTSLKPSPVLYAATVIADAGGDSPAPSARLEQGVKDLFGRVTRVTSWTKWRRTVSRRRPHLLVVLGHTDTERGEVRLHIGSRSKLAQPDIDNDVVTRTGEPPPILVLMACATAQLGGPFGTLPGAFAAHGAGAVVGTLSKINGPQGAVAAATLLEAIRDTGQHHGRLSQAMTEARRALVAQGLLVGLVLVSHGEIDVLLDEVG